MSERGEVFDRLTAWIDSEFERGTDPATITAMLAKCAAGMASSCETPREKFLAYVAEEFDFAETTE